LKIQVYSNNPYSRKVKAYIFYKIGYKIIISQQYTVKINPSHGRYAFHLWIEYVNKISFHNMLFWKSFSFEENIYPITISIFIQLSFLLTVIVLNLHVNHIFHGQCSKLKTTLWNTRKHDKKFAEAFNSITNIYLFIYLFIDLV
jgi:hypothetical protein